MVLGGSGIGDIEMPHFRISPWSSCVKDSVKGIRVSQQCMNRAGLGWWSLLVGTWGGCDDHLLGGYSPWIWLFLWWPQLLEPPMPRGNRVNSLADGCVHTRTVWMDVVAMATVEFQTQGLTWKNLRMVPEALESSLQGFWALEGPWEGDPSPVMALWRQCSPYCLVHSLNASPSMVFECEGSQSLAAWQAGTGGCLGEGGSGKSHAQDSNQKGLV